MRAYLKFTKLLTLFKKRAHIMDDAQLNLEENLFLSRSTNTQKVRQRALIVEDDIAMTNIIDYVLHEIAPSISIDWVTSAEEALRWLQKRNNSPSKLKDLIIVDILLEGELSGIELINFCYKNCKNLLILVTSATPREEFFHAKIFKKIPDFLQKPFSVDQCKAAIKAVLKIDDK